MSSELIINASLPETRIALMENGEIQELLIERASGKGIVGNIYKGRVTRVLPGMQAAFVDIGLEKAAFLYVDDVYVHSDIFDDEEEGASSASQSTSGEADESVEEDLDSQQTSSAQVPVPRVLEPSHTPRIVIRPVDAQTVLPLVEDAQISPVSSGIKEKETSQENSEEEGAASSNEVSEDQIPLNLQNSESDDFQSQDDHDHDHDDHMNHDFMHDHDEDSDDDDDNDEGNPVKMDADPKDDSPKDGDSSSNSSQETHSDIPEGTIAPESASSDDQDQEQEGDEDSQGAGGKKRHRRGRRGGRFRRKGATPESAAAAAPPAQPVQVIQQQPYPEHYHEQMADVGEADSDRSGLVEEAQALAQAQAQDEDQEDRVVITPVEGGGRPEIQASDSQSSRSTPAAEKSDHRADFRAHRTRDRRIRQKTSSRPVRAQVNIQDLLKEGQEILVQVAKDPIATKGARLTCHISLPGRHLVCMPTIDHVGVSRRIEREDERRRLREYVERSRPKNLGFIVRTASGKQSEKRVKQDIEYLTRLWNEIREKSADVTAPSLVYEDLNAVLRAVRDWVTEEIDKVIVDSRYHFNEIQRFVSHFMPPLKNKVELYHGDIPVFDAYGISTELSRSLERKVWLKSGGYIVIDQAEALVAIDVNTGRYVGKKNLEDTILKTNLEAVQEIAYQLRLRNCGGIIILDLIDMEKDENKQRVYRALEEALAKDRARPTIMKISELGLVEMTRKRTRDTIIRTLCESCTHCEGKGFIKSKQTVAYEVMREVEREGIERDVNKILVQAHPDVIDILAIDERETLDQLERRYRKQIYLQAVSDFHPEQFEVTVDKRDRADRNRSRDHHSSDRFHGRNQENDSENRRNRYRSETHVAVVSHSPGTVIEPVSHSHSAEIIEPNGVVDSNGIEPRPQSEAKIDIGNSVSSGVIIPANSSSEGVVTSNTLGNTIGNTLGKTSQDEFFDEEDRLAFLRAQAAQDAALARLGTAGAGHTPRPANTGDRERGTGGKRNTNRGRRNNNNGSTGSGSGGGGKFRRMNDRSRGRGPSKHYSSYSNSNPSQGPSSITPVSNSNDDSKGSGGGGEGVGGSSGGTLGGDHSQP